MLMLKQDLIDHTDHTDQKDFMEKQNPVALLLLQVDTGHKDHKKKVQMVLLLLLLLHPDKDHRDQDQDLTPMLQLLLLLLHPDKDHRDQDQDLTPMLQLLLLLVQTGHKDKDHRDLDQMALPLQHLLQDHMLHMDGQELRKRVFFLVDNLLSRLALVVALVAPADLFILFAFIQFYFLMRLTRVFIYYVYWIHLFV
ncbi:hypothetical protein O0L34_g10934 [Tuta absoluta]|nr:hypothetical protein O0L34_g10934 [Tuta absoluta]